MKSMIIIVDSKVDYFSNPNDIFNKNIAVEPGMTFWPIFYNIAISNNFKIYELQDAIKNNINCNNAFGISFEGGFITNQLFNKLGIKKSIIYSAESPNVAFNFYKNLNKITNGYNYIFLFSGCKKYLKNNSNKFYNFYFPNDKEYQTGLDFENRNLLCFVSSAKSNRSVNYSSFLSRLIRHPRYIYYKILKKCYPIFYTFNDLYEIRFKYIIELANSSNFFLFGRGWDLARKYDNEINKLKFINLPKEIINKHSLLQNFKFILCFENCDFEGYVTEKIFDAFLNGSVPVYYGTDLIKNLIPNNCFINAKDFKCPKELLLHLESISEFQWRNYQYNIKAYIESQEYNKFTSENLAQSFIQCIKKSYSEQEI
jgi:hypothetical protein